MKGIASAYTFTVATKTVWSPDLIAGLPLLIVNLSCSVPAQRILFNFSDATKGGAMDNNGNLILDTDLTGMADSDELLVYVENMLTPYSQEIGQIHTEGIQSSLSEIVRQLQSIRNDGGMADTAGRVRVAIETGSVSIATNQDIRNITGALANITSAGGYQVTQATFAMSNICAQGLRSKITTS